MSRRTVGEAIKKFANLIESNELIGKYEQVIKLYNGTLSIARDKLVKLNSEEAAEFLSHAFKPGNQDLIKANIIEGYNEEIEKATCILDQIDTTIATLQTVYETVGQRLEEDLRNETGTENSRSRLAQKCYEDCRCILIFLKLKVKILRHNLLTPIDKPANVNPFDHCPDFKAIVFENGTTHNGKAIKVSESMEDVFAEITKAFGHSDFTKLFTSKGGEITDARLIKDDETLYASKGDSFLPILTRSCFVKSEASSNKGSEWVKLNVGGQIFYTSRTTLLNKEPNSMLARMFDQSSSIQPSCLDSSGAYLIDRHPKYFSPILNYLRSGSLILDPDTNPKGVLEEAQFFGIQSCIPTLETMLMSKDEAPLTRRDVISALIITPNKDALRFQGVNLTGADLSYLDLRNINFKYAKLRNAKLSYSNLSNCNFERADMTYVEMNCAILSGVRMACAIMEGANCSNCNFQDPSGSSNANMEGVNLRNAILEDSDLTGANLRVANLKHANLKATILRGAILAGADLGMCDLTGSDLHEANLRGANLKDASLELMINPLHMSQAIR